MRINLLLGLYRLTNTSDYINCSEYESNLEFPFILNDWKFVKLKIVFSDLLFIPNVGVPNSWNADVSFVLIVGKHVEVFDVSLVSFL